MNHSLAAQLASRFAPPEIRTEPRSPSAAATSHLPAMPAPRADVSPAKPAASAPVVYAGFSQSDIDRAVTKARAEERARVATVFASSASHGRERVCADLLTGPKFFSGTAIAKELAHMPTDAERDREKRQSRADASGAVWDRAIAANYGSKADVEPRPKASGSAASDVWDRALIANGYVKPAAADQSSTSRSAASDAWDKAIASISKQGVY